MKEKNKLINKALEVEELEALKEYYLTLMKDSIGEFYTGLSYRKADEFKSLKNNLEFLIEKYESYDYE